MTEPMVIQPGTVVRIEALYDSSVNHFGVMALWFLDLVSFDTSCPGPQDTFSGELSVPFAKMA